MRPLPSVWYEKRMLRYEDVYPVLYLKYRLLQPAKARRSQTSGNR